MPTHEIDAISFTKEIKETFTRYLYTTNLITEKESDLQKAFYSKLNNQFSVLNGPYIHCNPSYRPSFSIRELVEGKGPVSIDRQFLSFPREHFDPDQKLYSHQVAAIQVLKSKRNLVVATGTGSGKTECFLMPIFDSILSDPSPGLRAIIIYPMNALANDQLRRLRELLAEIPQITFGRYTSETGEDSRQDERTSLPNERMTRKEIRERPPHILLTNFAMLEYLLLRPRDADIFKNHKLRFIVLDEAHTYSGAQGIDIAMLMRRLQQYLCQPPKNIQFILTSATFGGKEDPQKAISEFATKLTGAEYEAGDVLRGEIINSFAQELMDFPTTETLTAVGKQEHDFDIWSSALKDTAILKSKLQGIGLEIDYSEDQKEPKLLYDLFSKSKFLAKIHDHCQNKPSSLEELCGLIGLDSKEENMRALWWLIVMGANAKKSNDSMPLLPTRLHLFFRGLAGATVCVNENCNGRANHNETKWSEFYLEDCRKYEHCESKVLPLLTCVHCGLPVLKIYIVDDKWQAGQQRQGQVNSRLLTWRSDLEIDDEEADQQKAELCLACGGYAESPVELHCCNDGRKQKFFLIKAENDGNLHSCPMCGGVKGIFPSVLRDFNTSEDAPTAILAETIIRKLPYENNAQSKKLPAHGRNLLAFSDSRQRAAFFAPYLEQTTAESAYLSPLIRAIKRIEEREKRPVTFDEAAREYVRGLANMSMAVIKKQSDFEDEPYEISPTTTLLNAQKSAIKNEAELVLYRNFCVTNQHTKNMRGCGVAALRFEFIEVEKDEFPAKLKLLFNDGAEKGWAIFHALLEIFVSRIAIALPDNVSITNLRNPGPKAVTFHLSQSGRDAGRVINRWNPYLAAENLRKQAIRKSRQLAILEKSLRLDKQSDANALEKLLTDIWDALRNTGILVGADQWPGEYRIDHNRLQVTTCSEWYACNRCGKLSTQGKMESCPSINCPGQLDPLTEEDKERRFELNHYHLRYSQPELPLRVKEHTAQLNNAVGKEYQDRFIKGEINVLSSSTTFEMGIDVGELKAVLLRNVPPSTSSYIQRTGRAGRRRDGVSVAVTYARTVPHDQYNYQKPENIILGKASLPYLHIGNKPLTQRHCNSLLFGYFLRSIDDIEQNVLHGLSVYDFFFKQFNGQKQTICERYILWCSDPEKKKALFSYLKAIIPPDTGLTEEPILKASINKLAEIKSAQVDKPLADFEEQIKQLEEQIKTLPVQLHSLSSSRTSLVRLQDQFKDQKLIDFLSTCSWLPGYAFPQDIVKLIVRQGDYSEKMRLERDREFGISEYAPGAEIIADGRLFRSRGVNFNSQEPDIRIYTNCPQCRSIQIYLQTEDRPNTCNLCGTGLLGANGPRPFLKPHAFTTDIKDEVRTPSLSRLRPPRSSEVFLLEGAAEFREHTFKNIIYGIKENGRLFRANSGYKYQGFFICKKCGKTTGGTGQHDPPWGSKFTGSRVRIDLAHEIVTDILQLRFDRCNHPAPDLKDKSFWLSIQHAFLNGITDALDISPADLSGTYHGVTQESWKGELVIYDRIPGGAGHIQRVIENLDKELYKTLERVRDCKCADLDSGCYACLRNYYNQFDWE